MEHLAKVRTCFWFAKGGLEAAREYVSLVPDSRIDAVRDSGQPDDPMIVEFTLAGAPMMILTAGPYFEHSPAASISVLTDDQDETDNLWSALISNGGEASQCGWLKDRFGVSWQIVPKRLPELLAHPDAGVVARVQDAMMKMGKIEIADLDAAVHPT
jgi:predicted 3-demethylubiquinone-9 3-methyltransferase (glyoxalase superfamily)